MAYVHLTHHHRHHAEVRLTPPNYPLHSLTNRLQGLTQPLIPPQRTPLPLWLALLLKRQRRAQILPPPWLTHPSLTEILELETQHFKDTFSPSPPLPPLSSLQQTDPTTGTTFHPSPPFLPDAHTATSPPNALPFHWFEMSELLLDAASDDIADADEVRRLLRDIREVRLAKMRRGVEALSGDGEGVRLDGIGAMEVSESRGFVKGVMEGLGRIGGGREGARREREREEREGDGGGGRGSGDDDYDEDEDMT